MICLSNILRLHIYPILDRLLNYLHLRFAKKWLKTKREQPTVFAIRISCSFVGYVLNLQALCVNMMFTSLQRIYPKERVAIHLPLSLGLHPDRLEVGVFSPNFDKDHALSNHA